MKKFFVAVVLSLVIVAVTRAQTVVVELSTTMTNGKWDSPRPLTWVREELSPGLPTVYSDDQVPDHNALSTQDVQTWYVPVADNAWWKYTFSAKTENLKNQYAIRVSVDGLLSEWVAKVIGKGRNPRSG